MVKCYHCGEEIYGEPFNCSECGQSYCNLHRNPINHDCNIVRESLISQQYQASDNAYSPVSPSYIQQNSTYVPIERTVPNIQEQINRQQAPSFNLQYGTTASGAVSSGVRGTTDGSFTWYHQEKFIPENAFEPGSGIEFKGILWSHKSEFTHFLIGATLMYIIGFLLYFPICLTFNNIFTELGKYMDVPYTNVIWMAFLAAGLFAGSFILHELGHRQTAKHYELQTKFRLLTFGMMLTFMSLIIGVLALFTNIPPLAFALPGAVVVLGLEKVDNRTGWCKTMGPLMNLILGITLLIIAISIPNILFPLNFFLLNAALFNCVLGLFNMIPIGILDGQNIFKWSKPIYFFLVGSLSALLFICLSILYAPAEIKIIIPDYLKPFISF
ncbi:MAG: hypothetical protein ACTSQG_05785 [Promethearchaeota archaeon]